MLDRDMQERLVLETLSRFSSVFGHGTEIENNLLDASRQLACPARNYGARIFLDGNKWCCLLGDNMMEGIVGFGDSPDAAVWAFRTEWYRQKPAEAAL